MHRKWIIMGALLGLTGVAAGAFGAHTLKGRLTAGKLVTFEVGVRYQMYHALALLAVAWVISLRPSRAATAAGVCMILGVVMFSGSLYGLSLTDQKWPGPVTPIGGTLLMVGWLMLAVAGAKADRAPKARGSPERASSDGGSAVRENRS